MRWVAIRATRSSKNKPTSSCWRENSHQRHEKAQRHKSHDDGHCTERKQDHQNRSPGGEGHAGSNVHDEKVDAPGSEGPPDIGMGASDMGREA